MTPPSLALRERQGKDRLCPYCRSAVEVAADSSECEGCATLYHQSCWDELGGCSTLGCARQAPRPPKSRAEEPPGPVVHVRPRPSSLPAEQAQTSEPGALCPACWRDIDTLVQANFCRSCSRLVHSACYSQHAQGCTSREDVSFQGLLLLAVMTLGLAGVIGQTNGFLALAILAGGVLTILWTVLGEGS